MILTKHGINQEISIKYTSKPEPASLYDLLATVHFHTSYSEWEREWQLSERLSFFSKIFSVLLFWRKLESLFWLSLICLFCKTISGSHFWKSLSFLDILFSVESFFCSTFSWTYFLEQTFCKLFWTLSDSLFSCSQKLVFL